MAKGSKKLIKASVRDSIKELLLQAESAHKKANLAHKSGNRKQETENRKQETRYLEMVIDLVKKHKIRLTKDQKNMFCKKCFTWFEQGKNVKLIYDQKHHLIRIVCQCGAKRTI
jgi:RNase P subunit RPR2